MFIRYLGLFLFTVPLVVGCGQPADAPPTHPMSQAAQMRAKLNAMSVPDRLAYIKQHREVIRTVAGASGPLLTSKPPEGMKPQAGGTAPAHKPDSHEPKPNKRAVKARIPRRPLSPLSHAFACRSDWPRSTEPGARSVGSPGLPLAQCSPGRTT